MRILYLCKRQYMGHDVIEDRYARLYEQPFQLAELGHDVLGICLSYRNCSSKNEAHATTQGGMHWIGLTAGKFRLNLFTYPFSVLKLAKQFKPDIIIGASDCLHIVLANHIASKLNKKFAVDLYDHFESFGMARIPLLKHAYRNSVINAHAVSCVSEPLTDLVKHKYLARGQIITLHSTINHNLFFARDKYSCRQKLNLPLNAKLIGTAGGLSKEKGIKPVYDAFLQMAKHEPNLHLVLAGTIDPSCPPPDNDRVHYLGSLPHEEIATLFCALDVGIVYLRDTPYGKYSFPQKVYEICACQIPLVITNVGYMGKLFKNSANTLYKSDDTHDLMMQVKRQLLNPSILNIRIMDWKEQAKILEQIYLEI